jgi:hypothetical protein
MARLRERKLSVRKRGALRTKRHIALRSTVALRKIKSEARTGNDGRHYFGRGHCGLCSCRLGGGIMITFFKWLRRPAVSAPPPEQRLAFCGVTFNRRATDTATIDAEFTAEILKRIASNTFFELRSIE